MARQIESRLKITCTLIARTPIHVGGAGGNVDTDLALAVNGKGDLYIPGTSIAGAFRGWFETRAGDEENAEARKKIARLFGYQKQTRGTSPEKNPPDEHASFLLVEDVQLTPPPGKEALFAEIRDGVGIDRFTGAAAKQIKFDRAILPRGTRLNLDVLVELNRDETARKEAREMIDTLLQALRDEEIRFGAARSRGLGRVEVAELHLVEQGLFTKAALLDTLRRKEKPIAPGPAKREELGFVPRPRIIFDIDWKPRGPLMVKAERDGFAVDMLPLTSAIDADLTFALPGSSLKGAFRSQAERIVRTLLSVEAVKIVERKQDFLIQIDVKKPGLIGWVFGSAGDSQKEDERQYSRLPGLSAVSFDDCYATETRFSAERWAAIERAKDEQVLRQAIQEAAPGVLEQAFHVAIDRWLGSAADGMLYSVLEPHGVAWEPIRLTLDLARLPDPETGQRALMLLLLVLRDFIAGRIPLGFGVNRGMGAVEVTQIRCSSRDCAAVDWLAALPENLMTDGKLRTPDALREKLETVWRSWIQSETGKEAQ